MKSTVIAALACAATILNAGAGAETAPAESRELAPLVAGDDFFSPDTQLTELIGVLLQENPQIQSARAAWHAGLERVPQARSLADPTIGYRYFGSSPETRVGPQVQGLEYRQQVPWMNKRKLQAQRAEQTAAGMAWNARDLERALVATLKQVYFDVAYVQEALTVNSEEAALLRRFEEIALTRYSTGEGIQQSVIKVQTDISRLADQDTMLRTRLSVLERRIAQLIGRPHSKLNLPAIPLRLQRFDYDASALQAETFGEHPEVQAVERQIEADETWYQRAKLQSRPDFNFGAAYVDVGRREDAAGMLNPPEGNGKNSWSVSVGLNLPVFRRKIRAGIAEAQASLRSTERLLESTRDQLSYAIQEAQLRVEAADQRARLYRDVIVPQARESLASAEAAYATDRQDFLDLLDAERVLFQVRLTSHRLLADYWIALADLELGLGRRFPDGGANR